MYQNAARFVLIASFAALASAQPTADRVFHLTQTETPQEFQEIATTIRSVASVRQVFADAAQKQIFVHGTDQQIRLAEFLVNELNKPVPETDAARRVQNSTPHEFRLTGDERFNVVRVYYLDYVRTPQELQEAVTLIRSLANIQWVFIYNKLEAIALRGNAAQVELAAWLVNELNKPPRGAASTGTSQTAAMHEYKVPDGGEAVRMFYTANSAAPQRLQEIAVVVRNQTEMKRIFINNAQKAIGTRGTPEQLAGAEQIVREMDKPPVVQ